MCLSRFLTFDFDFGDTLSVGRDPSLQEVVQILGGQGYRCHPHKNVFYCSVFSLPLQKRFALLPAGWKRLSVMAVRAENDLLHGKTVCRALTEGWLMDIAYRHGRKF